MMAPSKAMIMVVVVTNCASTSPFVMVLATAVPTSAPARLVVAAMAMARRGVSALVETPIAMELAVSWKPLMYSNANATSRTVSRSSMIRVASGVLQHDMEDDVAGVAAAVDDFSSSS